MRTAGGLSVVLLDLDDTVYPEAEYVASGFRAVARMLSTDSDEQRWLARRMEHLSLIDRQRVFDRFADEIGNGRRLLGACNLGVQGPELIGQMISCYRSHIPDIRLFPEVTEILAELGRVGVGLGVVTDGFYEAQRRKVEALGLEPLIDFIVYTDLLGPDKAFWKPSPRGFQKALEHFNVSPSQACYVADNPSKDFRGPQSLGMMTVRIRRGTGLYDDSPVLGPEPDFTISCLTEMRNLVDISRQRGPTA